MNKLTPQEEELMLCFWQLESATIKEAMELMPHANRQPYTTVASIAKNLERKGYVNARKVGTTYLYTPAIQQTDYKRSFMSEVVRSYFRNSYKELVNFFAKEKALSTSELKEIIDIIENGKEDDK